MFWNKQFFSFHYFNNFPFNWFIFISGISDVAKDSGIVVNPSRANESARIYAITKFVKKYVEDAKLGRKLVLFSSFQNLRLWLLSQADIIITKLSALVKTWAICKYVTAKFYKNNHLVKWLFCDLLTNPEFFFSTNLLLI